MSDFVPPKQSPKPFDPAKADAPNQRSQGLDPPPRYTQPQRGSGGGGGQIAIGTVMLVAGVGLSVAGTGRLFIGLIVFGIISIVKGIANASK